MDERLPDNSLMTQCSRKLIKLSDEETKKRIDEINNCHHLFVKLKENPEFAGDPNAIIVECVHCGVTNKFHDLENTMLRYRKSLEYYMLTAFHRIDFEYNNETIESMMMREIMQRGDNLELMSFDIIRTVHPGLLYEIAKSINPDGSREELFQIMRELNDLETKHERSHLVTIEDASELIKRYKGRQKSII